MTHDEELIERVKTAMIMYNPNDDMAQLAIAAVRAYDAERRSSVLDADALKTFDPKETESRLLMAAWRGKGMTALAELFSQWNEEDGNAATLTARAPVPFVSTPDNSGPPTITTDGQTRVLDVAALVERYDPDDYRDLPVAMTGAVRFKGGLTEGKP